MWADELGAPLRGRGGDARLQLLAAVGQCLDALRHRIARGGRRVDREQHRECCDARQERRDPQDIDAETGWSAGFSHDSRRSSSDLETHHLGHDQGAEAHPDQAADAREDRKSTHLNLRHYYATRMTSAACKKTSSILYTSQPTYNTQ